MPPASRTPFNSFRRPGATGITRERPNRSIADATPVGVNPGTSANNVDIFTYQTDAGATKMLYSGNRLSATVTLILQTAGPVVVGWKQQLKPVLAGLGWSLQTGQPFVVPIAQGQRLYIASSAVNLVSVTIAPTPWAEQIAGGVAMIASKK